MATKKQYYATGRRKSSVAKVYLTEGSGKIIVNGKDVKEYFPQAVLVLDLKQPLEVLGVVDKYDINAHCLGGGFTGQTGALRLGITRALLLAGEDRATLKASGFITRDPRAKERKKYGLKKARRAPQFSKR